MAEEAERKIFTEEAAVFPLYSPVFRRFETDENEEELQWKRNDDLQSSAH